MKEATSTIEDVTRRILRKGEVEVNEAMRFSWDDLRSKSISIHFEPDDALGVRKKAALWFEGLKILRERLREARRTGNGELAKVQQINATSWIVKTNPGYLTREGFKVGREGVSDPLQMSKKLLDLYDKKRALLRPEHRRLDPMFAWISVEDFIDELGSWGSRAEKANARALVDIERKRITGEEYPEDVVFLHATSIEVLERLLKKGNIPGRTYETSEHKLGDLFVYPLAERLSGQDLGDDVVSGIPHKEQATREDIVNYAELQAWRHYVLSKLGRFDNPGSMKEDIVTVDELLHGTTPATLDDEVERPKMEAFLQKYSDEHVAHLIAEARSRRGVILGITRNTLKKFPVHLGDPGEGDLKLVTGKMGLTIADIGIVQILGSDGKAFFDDLRQRL